MIVKNITSQIVSISDIQMYGIIGITIKPGQEVTLYDEDAKKSDDIKLGLKNGWLLRTGDEEPGDVAGVPIEKADKIMVWVKSTDVAIQFADPVNGSIQNTFNGTHGVPVTVELYITNGLGVLDVFNSESTVDVSADFGTVNNVTGNVVVSFVDGVSTLSVNRTNAGDVNLTLSGGNTSLNKDDTAIITFS